MSSAVRFWPHVPDVNVASTRIRCLQVIDGLVDAGVDAALFDPAEPAPAVLVLGKRYDAESLARAEELRHRHGTRIVLDLCDNHFHHGPSDVKWARRAASLRTMCAKADLVVAASAELEHVIRQQVPEARSLVVPDSLDQFASGVADRKDLKARFHAWRWHVFAWRNPVKDGRRLLWFGNHGFPNAEGGMLDLERVGVFLDAHHARTPLTLCVVSNNWRTFRRLSRAWRFPSLYLPWTMSNFLLAVQRHDVALIPLRINPFTRCKTNNRMATAFMNGLAVAADELPAYEDFRDVAVLGDWDHGLQQLMDDQVGRDSRIEKAQRRLGLEYSVSAITQKWKRILCQPHWLGLHTVPSEMEAA